ncbi:hypothetical protein O6H91_07G021400 [Diphasiastrum complanatum]|uniref:Uncharacterized protein n=1 Tax=Diphasiastrum complanatum TaxID=34168 RepID=A0ACC2D3G2_DIPCM|nr:hypothetical protein O6H91_07G021400 [Diphasiastrum complanatum]
MITHRSPIEFVAFFGIKFCYWGLPAFSGTKKASYRRRSREMPGSGSSPCAGCKLLRRRCAKECVFAPYFTSDEPQKFAYVHKIFGASNISKMLQRGDAVSSIVYEASARIRDPVYGCVGAISSLQQQVAQLQSQLAIAQAELLCLRMQDAARCSNVVSNGVSPPHTPESSDVNHCFKHAMTKTQPPVCSENLWT